MKDIDKRKKKLLSVNRRDLWDRYYMSFKYYNEYLKEKLKQTTGGIRWKLKSKNRP